MFAIVGNAKNRRGLEEQQLKTQSPVVEMFGTAKTAHFTDNIEEKCLEKRKNNRGLKKQLLKGKSFAGNWIFKA